MPAYSLQSLILYFLKLGTTGFGGPVALVGYMQRDLVEDKKWISEEDFKTGLALAQLAPGPLAAQLGIYLGFIHYGIIGASFCGLAFVLPSFIMVVLLGIAYRLYGGLSWMQAVFYGVGASVIGIIVLSAYKLTIKSIGKISYSSFREHWLLWLFYIIGVAVTAITQKEEVLLFITAGLVYMLVKAPPTWLKNNPSPKSLLVLGFIADTSESSTLTKLALFFAKAGTFVFGSGLAIVPFLHSGVVSEYHWLDEKQFVDSVAVAMITPGPVVITVSFIGYLVDGFSGASVAAIATFLPCYLLTILPAPYFKHFSNNPSIKAFVQGITAAVVGALLGAVIVIATQSITDISTSIIALTTIVALVYIKKLQEPYIIAIAALIGLILKSI
ncbi:chromate transporter [Arcicella lustrica]|uniref:Chromate transporter n=1 Tax=Arcicella lustrica TaxID=2984196 RepID=A0ABU5SDB8_9BACT|nr:chromate transporter [Arcicella sp. DC25W]MEA5425261.1 chromate transporter [Arcicella sp. DC25W]